MTDKEYQQKKAECWEEFRKEHPEISCKSLLRNFVDFIFDHAYALGKQAKDAEETSLLERHTDTSSKERTMDKDEKFMPVEYEPIGCKNYPDIMDAVGAQLTRKYERPYYDKRSETIKWTLI